MFLEFRKKSKKIVHRPIFIPKKTIFIYLTAAACSVDFSISAWFNVKRIFVF